METTSFLAQFWGSLLLILSLIYLLRGKRLIKELVQLVDNKAFVPLSGYISLIIGLLSVILYNEWTYDKMLIVTIIGWLSLIKGVVRIGYPEAVHNIGSWLKNYGVLVHILLVLTLLLGAWLLWF